MILLSKENILYSLSYTQFSKESENRIWFFQKFYLQYLWRHIDVNFSYFWQFFRKNAFLYPKSHQSIKNDIHIFIGNYLRNSKMALLFFSDQVFGHFFEVFFKKKQIFIQWHHHDIKISKDLVWEKWQYHFRIHQIIFLQKDICIIQ